MKRLFLILLVPFLLAMSEPPQQKMMKHVVVKPTVDWTLVIVAGFGALGACVPAYFGYKGIQRRRAKRED